MSGWIRTFINHDHFSNRIMLLLRTKDGDKYTYMGDLAYLTHNADREQPVYFHWQIIEWEIRNDIFKNMELILDEYEYIPQAAADIESHLTQQAKLSIFLSNLSVIRFLDSHK